MPDARSRLDAQFTPGGDRAEIWRAFDLVLDTDRYLNLGYSPRGVPTLLGSSQRRLARQLGRRVAAELDDPSGARVLDLGCGRGGPAVDLATTFDFAVTGVDLVAWNATRARETARRDGVDADFVVGDALTLPLRDGSFDACTAIDAGAYVPARTRAFSNVHDALAPGGTFVTADLLAKPGLDADTHERFTTAWDFAALPTSDEYERALSDAGFTDVHVEDISPHSIARFGKYTRLYRAIEPTPLFAPIRAGLARLGIDVDAVTDQIRATHDALPFLTHVIATARR